VLANHIVKLSANDNFVSGNTYETLGPYNVTITVSRLCRGRTWCTARVPVLHVCFRWSVSGREGTYTLVSFSASRSGEASFNHCSGVYWTSQGEGGVEQDGVAHLSAATQAALLALQVDANGTTTYEFDTGVGTARRLLQSGGGQSQGSVTSG